jgi:hypothetical protein
MMTNRPTRTNEFFAICVMRALGANVDSLIERYLSNCEFCRAGYPLEGNQHDVLGLPIPCMDRVEMAEKKPAERIVFKGRGIKRRTCQDQTK